MKEVEIQCPCCDSQLLIDVLTQKVLRATPRRELDSSGRPKLDAKDWDAAFGKVSGRLDESVSKFDASLGSRAQAHPRSRRPLRRSRRARPQALGRRGGRSERGRRSRR